jgi:hypothetical protein
MMHTLIQKTGFIVFFCCSFFLLQAQPTLKTTIDKDHILIGEQIQLKVQAIFPQEDFFVKWISIPDSLDHFEVVNRSKIDSLYHKRKLTGLEQTFTITSFDSGKWVFPSFNVSLNPAKDDTTFNLLSDSFLVTISFKSDTTDAIRDIKPIREAQDEIPLWYWIAGAIALLLLILLCVWLYRRFKKKKKLSPSRSSKTAYEQAMNELDKLKNVDLSTPSQIKLYHSGLAEVFRQYLSNKTDNDLSSMTTADILILLNKNDIDKDQLSKVAAALRLSNAVKFAKYLPGKEESEISWFTIKDAISFTEKSFVNR